MSTNNLTSIKITSSRKEQFIDVTGEIAAFVRKTGVSDGICLVYVPHTTAAVTINENADPDVRCDMIAALAGLVPDDPGYRHAEGNSPAHVKSSLIGCSLNVFIQQGQLTLGTWQGIYFCEFDGPRSRKVNIKVMEG